MITKLKVYKNSSYYEPQHLRTVFLLFGFLPIWSRRAHVYNVIPSDWLDTPLIPTGQLNYHSRRLPVHDSETERWSKLTKAANN